MEIAESFRRFNLLLLASAFAFGLVIPLPMPSQTNPSDAIATATALIRSQQYDRAIAVARGALVENPASVNLWIVEAIAYSSNGNDVEALKALDRALKLAPGQRQALEAEAQILSKRHDPKVIPVLEQILRVDAHDATALEMLALAKARSGDCKTSLPLFTALGPVVADHVESLQQEAACLLQEGKLVEARPVLERLVVLTPGDAEARYNLAVAQLDAGQAKAAITTLEPVLASTKDVDTLVLASDAFEAVGDTPRSVALLRSAIVADPSRANSYVRFAELCMSHESYEAGIEMVSAGLSRLPGNASLLLARGLLYGGLAQYDKAEADFLLAERNDPQHGVGAYAVGVIDMQRNHPEQALQDARKGLRHYPNDAQLLFLLGRVLLESGAAPGSPEYAEAQRAAEKSAQINPNLLQAHDLLAKIYQETGRPQDAVAQCRMALIIDPGDGQALYRLMRSLRSSGKIAEAEQVAHQVAAQRDQQRSDETDRLRYKIRLGSAASAALPDHP